MSDDDDDHHRFFFVNDDQKQERNTENFHLQHTYGFSFHRSTFKKKMERIPFFS